MRGSLFRLDAIFNVCFFSLVPPPVFLHQMYKGHVVAKLDTLVQFSEYSQVLIQLDDEEGKPADKPASKSSEKHPAKSSVKPPSKAKGKDVPVPGSSEQPLPEGPPSKRTRRATSNPAVLQKFEKKPKTGGVVPSAQKPLIGVGLEMASFLNLADMRQVTRLSQFLTQNGGWELLSTPKDGQCMLSAIRKGLACPDEFRNNHLRYHIVYFIAENHGFFYTILKDLIKFEYGQKRMDRETYLAAMESGVGLDDETLEAYQKPGPFSFLDYLKYMLEDGSWGDHGMLIVVSMMWQLAITILNAEDLDQVKIRHDRELDQADMVIVFAGRSHYLGTCKYISIFLFYFKIGYFVQGPCGDRCV